MFDLSELAVDEVTGRVESSVTQQDTAQTLGSGDLPVLGTPRLLAWAEAACVFALTRRMPTTLTSVGVRVRLDHRRPVLLGGRVTVSARLREREGARLLFGVDAVDEAGRPVADGELERRVVDRDEFMTRARG